MPERRQFLAAMSLLSMDLGAEAAEETIYIPSRQLETDRAFIAGFIDEYAFAMVVTAKNGIRVTNGATTTALRSGKLTIGRRLRRREAGGARVASPFSWTPRDHRPVAN